MKTVIYAAKSTDDDHGSIGGQLARCREYAERNGWVSDSEHTDEAVSGFTKSRGPGLAAALKRASEIGAEDGEGVLLVFDTDRLARGDAKRAAHLVEYAVLAIKHDFMLASVANGPIDLLHGALLGDRAHLDSKAKSGHVKAGKERSAKRGRRNGGPRPYGYRSIVTGVDDRTRKATTLLTPVPGEAEVVRQIFDLTESGLSQASVARRLNADGHRTVYGRPFSQSQVSAILRRPIYVGRVSYYGETYPGEHEAIITVEQFARVGEILTGRRRNPGNSGGRKPNGGHLLPSGFFKCSCGGGMVNRTLTKRDGTQAARYRCEARHSGRSLCKAPHIDREAIDSAVWAYFEDASLDLDAMILQAQELRLTEMNEIGGHVASAETELARARSRLDRVRRDYQDGKLDADDWTEQRAPLTSEVEAATSALDRLHARQHEIDTKTHLDVSEKHALETLAEIRRTVNDTRHGGGDIEAARAALKQAFAGFVFHWRHDASDRLKPPARPGLSTAHWFIEPVLHKTTAHDPETRIETTKLTRPRVPVSMEGKPTDSRR